MYYWVFKPLQLLGFQQGCDVPWEARKSVQCGYTREALASLLNGVEESEVAPVAGLDGSRHCREGDV